MTGDRRRVVVTGMGVKAPAGNDPKTVWSVLLAGRSVVAPVRRFDTTGLPVGFAAEVVDFDPVTYLGPKGARQVDRATQLGVAAALDAVEDAAPGGVDPRRCGIIAGTGLGGLQSFADQNRAYLEQGPGRISPRVVPLVMPNATAGAIAIQLGWTGPNMCIATACASGAHAIGEGARMVRQGDLDVALVGGTEAAVTAVGLAAFARMGALSTRRDEPDRAARPFDVARDGFVMGEGAAFFVLEAAGHALARGARIYGEVAGYGRTCDAFHITAPAPAGTEAVACMRLALDDAGLAPGEIGHVNAHGTSTPLNDAAEAAAIGTLFGPQAPPVTSLKGTVGHLVGAAGALDVLASLLAMDEGQIPPTANFERTDPGVSLDVVAGAPRTLPPRPVLSNSFGFGGHNATLVLTPSTGVTG